MANSMRCFTRMSLGMLTSNVTRQFQHNSKRTLFAEASMSLPEYKSSRAQMAEKYQSAVEGFKEKMEKNTQDEQGIVFTEDLKTMLHLAEKNSTDVELLKKLLDKFTNQNNEIRFGSFKFGPVVMRTFHYLNEPKAALELFLDPRYKMFFNQMTSFMIVLDLLYENKMYKEVIETYDHIRTNVMTNSSHPRLAIPILAMACYKQNTPESLEFGLKVCEELSQKGSTPLRRVIATLGVLALNQNKPHVALELVALCRTIEYISMRCVRVMALADLDRVDDIVLEFQAALKRGAPERYSYYSDVATKVEAAIERLNISADAEIVDLLETLKSRGYIIQKSMDDYLSTPIESFKKDNDQFQGRGRGNYHDQGWNDTRQSGGNPNNNRRALRDSWSHEQQFA